LNGCDACNGTPLYVTYIRRTYKQSIINTIVFIAASKMFVLIILYVFHEGLS